jgi:hypothetical protein
VLLALDFLFFEGTGKPLQNKKGERMRKNKRRGDEKERWERRGEVYKALSQAIMLSATTLEALRVVRENSLKKTFLQSSIEGSTPWKVQLFLVTQILHD